MALIGDIERQLRWALICGIDVHWYALICGTDGHWHVALTGGTSGATLIIRAHGSSLSA
ncbi:unnamed protein product [Staurois parvus]|uniref:Uncharacterized protein n=1 Tax=Staurois parvus TaxID=386267 RepID=A0ABN9AH73_9NEOB|nr:unnamed protein product [Staurois parvus]